LDNDEVAIIVGCLDDTKIINLTIGIEVKVGECGIGIIKQSLKLLEIFGLSKECSDSFEVKILRDVG
jgi:hypothetical protein